MLQRLHGLISLNEMIIFLDRAIIRLLRLLIAYFVRNTPKKVLLGLVDEPLGQTEGWTSCPCTE